MKPTRQISYLTSLLFLITFSCSNEQELIPTYVKPVDTHFFKDGEVEMIFENNRNDGINVIFLGDGYQKQELGKTYGSYRKKAVDNIKALFESPPFSEYINHFNAYIVYAESKETGVNLDFDENQVKKNTKFGGILRAGGPGGLTILTIENYDAINQYVLKVKNELSEKNLILISINQSSRGSAGLNSNLAIFGSLESTQTTIHEVGHAFGGLYDEYSLEKGVEDYDVTYAPNLDSTSDLSKVKWHHFIDLKDFDYNSIGAYEGGGYNEFGIWRPDYNSVMRSGDFFNAPSREAIVRRIFAIREITFDFNDFLAKDKISVQKIRTSANRNGRIDATSNNFNEHGICFRY